MMSHTHDFIWLVVVWPRAPIQIGGGLSVFELEQPGQREHISVGGKVSFGQCLPLGLPPFSQS